MWNNKIYKKQKEVTFSFSDVRIYYQRVRRKMYERI